MRDTHPKIELILSDDTIALSPNLFLVFLEPRFYFLANNIHLL